MLLEVILINAGTPFLVLLQSDSKTDKPEFIHLDTLGGISDEVTMGTACSFSLHLSRADIRFQTFTSTDYQDWMQALEIAYQLLHNNTQNIAVKQPVRATSQSSGPFRPTPSISRDDSEDLMKRAFAIRQSIEAAPIVSGSQFSKYQGSFENLSQRPVPPRKDSNQREE